MLLKSTKIDGWFERIGSEGNWDGERRDQLPETSFYTFGGGRR